MLNQFIRVPWAIYADDPNWVPPLILERRSHLSPKSNPYFNHSDVRMWLALRAEQPVGRITAQIDRASPDCGRDSIGQFGFLEAEDDAETFASLFSEAEAWLRSEGMTQVRGPFSFSINDESGLLVDGFDKPPMILMGHARPYYADRIVDQEYTAAKDLIAYYFPVGNDPLPWSARALVGRLSDEPNICLRPLNKSRYRHDLGIILDIFNDAWSDNWGFVPFVAAEAEKVANDLKPLIEENLVCIAEVSGDPVAFGVCITNINEAITDLNGALFPFGWAKLIYRLKAKKIRTARLPLLGLRKEFQGQALGAALVFAIIDRIFQASVRRGFTSGELSWILADNVSMNRVVKACGGIPYKTYRIYEKKLA